MDNIKSIVDLLIALYVAYVSATAGGGKLTWSSLIKLGPALLLLPTAINNAKAALGEFEVLSAEQDQQLSDYVASQLPNVEPAVLEKVKAAVDLALKIGGSVQDVMVLVKKAADAAPVAIPAAPAATV